MVIDPFFIEFSKKLRCRYKTNNMTRNLIEAYLSRKSENINPKEVIASAFYIVCKLTGEKKTQLEIGMFSGVSPENIRYRYRDMSKTVSVAELLGV